MPSSACHSGRSEPSGRVGDAIWQPVRSAAILCLEEVAAQPVVVDPSHVRFCRVDLRRDVAGLRLCPLHPWGRHALKVLLVSYCVVSRRLRWPVGNAESGEDGVARGLEGKQGCRSVSDKPQNVWAEDPLLCRIPLLWPRLHRALVTHQDVRGHWFLYPGDNRGDEMVWFGSQVCRDGRRSLSIGARLAGLIPVGGIFEISPP